MDITSFSSDGVSEREGRFVLSYWRPLSMEKQGLRWQRGVYSYMNVELSAVCVSVCVRERESLWQRPGLNFINVLCTAFTLVDPESVKKIDNLTVFFTLLGSACVKAVHRMLVKLTPCI